MEPNLVAVAGPLAGESFSIAEGESCVGRQAGNAVCIPDALMSRRHFSLRRAGGDVLLVDLGSTNGTFVNGIPVRERRIDHGDRIAAGDSVFLFLSEDQQPIAGTSPVLLLDDASDTRITGRLIASGSRYSLTSSPPTALPASERAVRDLDALVRIGIRIASMRGGSRIAEAILDAACRMLGAQRGALLIVDAPGEDPRPAAVWSQGSSDPAPLHVSRTIVHRALSEQSGVLCRELGGGETLHEAVSLTVQGVRSLVCVPLVVRDHALGVLYLDRLRTEDPFEPEDLERAAAVAGFGALALDGARGLEVLEDENLKLRRISGFESEMIGESGAMHEVYERIARVAGADTTVLLCGESGTGKELAARAIHLNGPRAAKPFVVVNCAVLSDTLLESDLFGHEKGAFTGAVARKIGKIEMAAGGTLFLDEVSEMAPALQAKLLRMLQEREIERVGGTTPIKVDVRVVAATNRVLEDEMARGAFRQDLFYRLNVVTIRMPPLRERKADIPLLASYFVSLYAAKFKRRVTGISIEARDLLSGYDWPGNVRELQNAVERAVVLGNSEQILPEDLPETLHEAASPERSTPARYHDGVREAKVALILDAMRHAGGRFTDAAKILGVHPNYLHRLVRNLKLRDDLRALRDDTQDD